MIFGIVSNYTSLPSSRHPSVRGGTGWAGAELFKKMGRKPLELLPKMFLWCLPFETRNILIFCNRIYLYVNIWIVTIFSKTKDYYYDWLTFKVFLSEIVQLCLVTSLLVEFTLSVLTWLLGRPCQGMTLLVV